MPTRSRWRQWRRQWRHQWWGQWRRLGRVAPLAPLLAGCGPDPVGTPIAWWHSLQGGAIAEQRPPPPGVDDPYPHVGTTPKAPAVPSVAVRDELTQSLLAQRYASTLTDARDPLAASPDAGARPAGPGRGAGATAAPATGGAAGAPAGAAGGGVTGTPTGATASLDAAGSPPPAVPGRTPVAPRPPPLLTPEQQEADEPKLAMPAPPPGGVTIDAAAPLPTMPRTPPAPPAFPNFAIPTTQVAALHPVFGPPPAADLAFEPGSDVLEPHARGALLHAASTRGGGRIRVTGYGDARSDAPADQAAALRLAIARATAAAERLETLGVPSSAIVLAGAAFGNGGNVTVLR